MMVHFLIPIASALLSVALAVVALRSGWRSPVHRLFAIGMIAIALKEGCSYIIMLAVTPAQAILWQHLRLFLSTCTLTIWLLFSLRFARAAYTEFLKSWRPIAMILCACPLLLQVFFGASLFTDVFALSTARWVLRLAWSGQLVLLTFLLGAVLIVVNLETTLRASTGVMRWQIKFMVLGLGGIFAAQIYTNSQALLVSSIDTALEQFNSAAIIVADVLIIFSLARSRLLSADIYLSQSFLYNSITLTIVGIYLISVGLLAKVVGYLGGYYGLTISTFMLFLALVGLSVVLLSGQLKQRFRRFINYHLKRPQYDYRKEWVTFTERTTSILDKKHLCAAVAGMVSDTLGIPAVTIWLSRETDKRLSVGGSTIISVNQGRDLKSAEEALRTSILRIRPQQGVVDFDQSEDDSVGTFKRSYAKEFRQIQMRYCVSLIAGGQNLGIMTLSDRLTREPLSLEDLDLLKTVADQTASRLLNAKLTEQLVRAREMEALQTVSAFFVHDLKNVATTLSLTLDNFRAYRDDPEFRQDALKTMAQSVDKINRLCTRLSLQRKRPELKLRKADLNEVVLSTVASFNGSLKAVLVQDLKPLPCVLMDPEEMQKVLVNLVLNANEAAGKDGKIEIATAEKDGSVVLSVSDDGCGMSDDFVSKSLFQPFQTTKKHGLGIGLFQSKSIVEAHGGKIEVESEEGKGSTFTIVVPVGKEGTVASHWWLVGEVKKGCASGAGELET